MRWVVSLLVVLLVLPVAHALDISFVNPAFHYTSDPVNLSFTTDSPSTCSYTLTQIRSQPDFSCAPSSCSYTSCLHRCQQEKIRSNYLTNVPVGTVDQETEFSISLELPFGFYEMMATCKNDLESASKSLSFLYDPETFSVDWSLLTRERFAKTQESIFYAYMYGPTKVDSVEVILTRPDRSNSTYEQSGFTPGSGYLYSFVLDDISNAGSYTLTVHFLHSNGQQFELVKHFVVVEPASFSVALDNPTPYDVEFIDPISNVTSFFQKNMSTRNILVPASRQDVKVTLDEVMSLYLKNVDVKNYKLAGTIYPDEYVLETETIGENKPIEAISTYIIRLNNSLEFISQVMFNYSGFDIRDPQNLEVFKAQASNPRAVDISSGEFYKVGSRQRPLYVDEEHELAWIFTNEFGLFSLVQERTIGRVVPRDPVQTYLNFTKANTTLEGIHRDQWTFSYGLKEYSFLINTIDGAIVYFEFSPNGRIQPANVGSTIRQDINDDQTDDIAIYVNAITPSKIVFSVYMLTQPEERSSLEEIIGGDENTRWALYVSTPWFWVYLGLALFILFFGIIWMFTHGHKKHVSHSLSKEEKEALDAKSTQHDPLVDAIKDLQSKGLDARDIENRLIAVGWPKDIVEKMLETQGIKKSTADLTEDEKILLEYVNKQLVLGATKEDVRQRLKDVGWKDEIIEKIFEVAS